MLPTQRALLSVSDKRGLEPFARALIHLGIELVSTGGTRRFLLDAGLPVTPVADITGFPEILDGRVKTLHPLVHGGILADRARANHLTTLAEHGIQPIDLIVVNLYPFEATVARDDADEATIIENIDIGGPTMVRAAAKNHQSVTVVVDPDDYPQVQAALEDGQRTVPDTLRRSLALKAFRHTQAYDAAITAWLQRTSREPQDRFPQQTTLEVEKVLEPRYGENPHQDAAVYRMRGGSGVFGGFEALQGKPLSWNNLLDADAARQQVALLPEPSVVIVKHNNPCGVGRGEDLVEAFERARRCDPVSAFGSVIALNRAADGALAEAMADLFVEVIIAPDFDDDARARFGRKKNLRLITCPLYDPPAGAVDWRSIDGGFLAQTPDATADDADRWTCVTAREPSADERQALEMAWTVGRMVKSNAIVLAQADRTVGIGAGQMSRVDACRIAIDKAREAARAAADDGGGDADAIDDPIAGAAAASDAFFPFRDGLDVLAEAGVTAVVQPGGSKRDDEVIAAANEHGITMLTTGTRHFRH